MTDKRDYYEVLGVDKSADEKDLKNAFRSLARKFHPDRSTEDDAEDKFKEIKKHMPFYLIPKSAKCMTDLVIIHPVVHHLVGLAVVRLTLI